MKRTGLVTRDDAVRGGWRVVPQAMLWWLVDELVRSVRSNTPFEEWLRAQELEHVLTRKERAQLGELVRETVQMPQQGAIILIEAFAKGLGEGAVRGTTGGG